MDLAIIYLLVICVCVQLFFWLFFFSRLSFCVVKKSNTIDLPAVSVVVCALNEIHNLKEYLPKILEQDYPCFEVLVVDDASTDGTGKWLSSLKEKYKHLSVQVLQYPKGKKNIGKKNALAKGIHQTKYDVLLLTDADCYPSSNQWIKIMVGSLKPKKAIGLGYGPYQAMPGILNAFIRFETVYTAIQYMSFALWKIPYMGVGRNLVYKKELFYKVGGFEKHQHVASGDDDLFVSSVANKSNTIVVLDSDTFMYSKPEITWRAYFRQKSRHVTTGTHYNIIHQILLGLLSLSHFGVFFFTFMTIINRFEVIFAIKIYLILSIIKFFLFARIANKLGERNLILLTPFLDIVYILYYVLLFPALFWGKTSKWK